MVGKVSVSVKFSGKLKRLATIDKQIIRSTIQGLVSKHGRILSSGAINLDIKQNGIKFRQIPLFECKANFWNTTNRKVRNIVATGQEYGIWQTVDRALNKIERKLVQQKEKKPWFIGVK
jgi:ribosome-associated translation inhibitor RaiA